MTGTRTWRGDCPMDICKRSGQSGAEQNREGSNEKSNVGDFCGAEPGRYVSAGAVPGPEAGCSIRFRGGWKDASRGPIYCRVGSTRRGIDPKRGFQGRRDPGFVPGARRPNEWRRRHAVPPLRNALLPVAGLDGERNGPGATEVTRRTRADRFIRRFTRNRVDYRTALTTAHRLLHIDC